MIKIHSPRFFTVRNCWK